MSNHANVDRSSDAYDQGRQAQAFGLTAEDNPYVLRNDNRMNWFSGWYDRYFEIKVANLEKRIFSVQRIRRKSSSK